MANLIFTRCPGVGNLTLASRKCQNPLGMPAPPWALTLTGALFTTVLISSVDHSSLRYMNLAFITQATFQLLLTARPWAERGSCFTRDLLLLLLFLYFFVGDQTQTCTRPNRVWDFEITQPKIFIRQKLLKHQCTENVADIVFFIVYKVYFLLVLSKRWIQSEC